jgi:uncharacterized protein
MKKKFLNLLGDKEIITFNLFNLIMDNPNASVWSDNKDYIIAQSNEHTPIWIWICKDINSQVMEEVAEIVSARVKLNPRVHINIDSNRCCNFFELMQKKYGISMEVYMPMNAYACYSVEEPKVLGKMVIPSKEHKVIMAKLIQQMNQDAANEQITDDEANAFATDMVGSKKLFLWEDKEIRAMAMIAHKSDKHARINTVVTERESRCKGYAGMLVAEVCKKLLGEGVIPMLYADARNPASNRAYQKIGFEKVGEITEYSCSL